MFTKHQILEALKKVVHPEKGIDIVSLGMVGGINVSESGISLTIVPERSNDPLIGSVRSIIVKTLKETLGPEAVISDIEVKPRVVVGKTAIKSIGNLPGIKNIIAVSSGKGGVGKTTVAVNLAIALARKNLRTGLLDADVFGPSVPKMFDAGNYRPVVRRENDTDLIVPLEKWGVRVLSTGFFVDPSEAVIWRGPMASNFLKQLMTQGDWGTLDYLIVDLPPGTSDIHLTLVQEVAVTGAIVVTTPQQVAVADAIKGIAMFRSEKIDVPVIGLVENMSWFSPAELPGNKYYIFGRDGGKNLALETGVALLGQIPLVQGICETSDSGRPVALEDSVTGQAFMSLAGEVIKQTEIRNRERKPTEKVRMNKPE
ncbi:MAG TPA: Mrp/NBP35 family ATP-binding protein [Bacteroidales bacterium]|nr:Mrp/NBP35 family ATP-binding protein [Bacteroidales bacterium]HPF02927.1 Mrp/NBP35 family ATP-binding protein [Bacteroidales bacterium]HPJ59197.1 Mrp/NBP35 family ATP-binding protein [Bacteroidales bacterium]HPR11820.1 Mrp/NBP35 family ATP-binding protein [Bacteroidales bacterium]HRW84031.1 Mrp/NBP35 family ATP-binding protein [Bacteroidales bacterium]